MISTKRTTVTSWFATCDMGWCAESAGSEHDRRDRRDQASRLEAHIDARVWQGRRGVRCAAGILCKAYLHDCGDEAISEVPLGVRSTLLSLAGTRSGAAVGKDSVPCAVGSFAIRRPPILPRLRSLRKQTPRPVSRSAAGEAVSM